MWEGDPSLLMVDTTVSGFVDADLLIFRLWLPPEKSTFGLLMVGRLDRSGIV